MVEAWNWSDDHQGKTKKEQFLGPRLVLGLLDGLAAGPLDDLIYPSTAFFWEARCFFSLFLLL